jgi:ribonucleotide monophosphatase NagD (HAD superfamily)
MLCRASSFSWTVRSRIWSRNVVWLTSSTTRLSETPARHASNAAAATSSSTSKIRYTTHSSFDNDIIDRYDAFILDQFGVLHNGQNALEGAVELVEHLSQKKDKKLIILSNTSAPADKALAKLPKFGFNPAHFAGGAVTSGEEASRYILKTFGSFSSSPSTKALMLTWDATDRDNPRLTALPEMFLEQCGNIQLATTVEDADFLLFHGSEVWYKGPDHDAQSLSPFIEQGDLSNVDALLKECRDSNLPAVCANPDFVVQTPAGDGVNYMPGKLAARYQELGGECMTFGKPAVEHFEACITKLGLDKRRVCHVGDSLHHDIAGACRAGIPSVFVTSGIHKSDLGTEFGDLPSTEALEKLVESVCEDDVSPTHVVPAFRL